MNSEAKLKTLDSQNIGNLNKNSTLVKVVQNEENPSTIDVKNDDKVANLLNKQNSTQKNFDSRNRISSILYSNTNIKSHTDLNIPLKPQKLQQDRQKGNSIAQQSSVLESKKIFDEGFEKGLNENLSKHLSKNFNELQNHLQPIQMNELRKSQNVKALQQIYSAVSTYRFLQATLNLIILFIGSYLVDELEEEWNQFWLILSGMLGIQIVFFIGGMLANIYWRFETNDNDHSCIKINQKCDLLFLIFFFIEFLFLSEFVLVQDKIYNSNYKYLLTEFILRAAIITTAYAFMLQKKKYFFIVFFFFIIYIPVRQSSTWSRYFISNIQIIFSSICLMLVAYNIRFVFKDSLDEAYKSTIFAYKDIISDLCLRIKHSQNLNLYSNLAEVILDYNDQMPLPETKKPQTQVFKPKKQKNLNDKQKNSSQTAINSKSLQCSLFDQKVNCKYFC